MRTTLHDGSRLQLGGSNASTRKGVFRTVLLALLCLAGGQTVSAQIVTITVSGTIQDRTNASGVPSTDPTYNATFPLGGTYTFSATYNAAAANSTSGSSTLGTFQDTTTFASTFTIGGYSYTTGGTSSVLLIYNNNVANAGYASARDGFEFSYGSSAVVGGFGPASIHLKLVSSNTSVFPDTSIGNLTSGTWTLANFDGPVFPVSVSFAQGNLYGSVTSISVSAIPEPGTWAAIGGALVLVVTMRRRASGQVGRAVRGVAQRKFAVWMALVALASGASAFAQIVTFQFSGTVTNNYAPGVGDPVFAAAFPVGSSYTATYTYDLTVPDVDARSTVGIYLGGASDNFNSTITLNGVTFSETHSTATVTVYNNQVGGYAGNTIDGAVFNYATGASHTTPDGFNLQSRLEYLYSSNLGLFSSDALATLTTSSYTLSSFNLLGVGQFLFSGGRYVDVSITGLSVSAIPEPGTWAAIAAGSVLAMTIWKRRRKGALLKVTVA